jgi:hypothetical protein
MPTMPRMLETSALQKLGAGSQGSPKRIPRQGGHLAGSMGEPEIRYRAGSISEVGRLNVARKSAVITPGRSGR